MRSEKQKSFDRTLGLTENLLHLEWVGKGASMQWEYSRGVRGCEAEGVRKKYLENTVIGEGVCDSPVSEGHAEDQKVAYKRWSNNTSSPEGR